jgi:TetR/AcrR family fatty acid metabolism transcriptional regulator
MRTFAEHGFSRARTRDIAAGAGVAGVAGVAEGTIYLYFRSKDDLLLTAFREKVGEFSAAVNQLLSAQLPFEERFRRLVEIHFARIDHDPALSRLLLLEARQSTKFYDEPVREALGGYGAAVDAVLESGVEDGALRPGLDVPLARRMLIGALREIQLEWLLGRRDRPLTELAAGVADMLLRGISAHG